MTSPTPAQALDAEIKLGIPKGSLQEATVDLFRRAGFKLSISGRSYYPSIDDPQITCLLVRAQEMARYVELGLLDAGLTGLDWVLDQDAKVELVADLVYSKTGIGKARWVLAVPENSTITSAKDLQGKRIATEAVNLTRRFLQSKGVEAQVDFSWGATEVKPPNLADAIVEITETGNSLRANKLRVLETVLETNAKLISNSASWKNPAKRKKIEQLALLLEGAICAEDKVGLQLNVPRKHLQAVLKLLPAMHNPTVSPLSNQAWAALNVVLEEKIARDIIPKLKQAGACDIVEYPLNKIIP